jgi:hypothetical protein
MVSDVNFLCKYRLEIFSIQNFITFYPWKRFKNASNKKKKVIVDSTMKTSTILTYE